jgi:23S rRNA pseudouridine2605 synthase
VSKQRLQKVLAAAGVDSRRKCEELILTGAVCVNRNVVDTLPAFVDPEKDVITVNGKKIRPERKVYFLLNKPKGVVCTNADPQGRISKQINTSEIRIGQDLCCQGQG